MSSIDHNKIRMEASNRSTIAMLTVRSAEILAEYAYGKKGTPAFESPDSFMRLLGEGSFGKIVGLWVKPHGKSYSDFIALNSDGEIYDSTNLLKSRLDDFKANVKYNDGKALKEYKLAVGPDLPLARLIEKYL